MINCGSNPCKEQVLEVHRDGGPSFVLVKIVLMLISKVREVR